MHCPNCGNELNENQKFCSKCGANLTDDKNYLEKFRDSDSLFFPLIIGTAIVILLLVGSGLSVFAYNKICDNIKNDIQIELPNDQQNYSEYKSITSIDSKIDTMTEKQALEKIIQQEQDLKEFFNQNHTTADNSILFTTFYENLITLSEKLDKLINNENNSVFLEDKTTTIINGIQVCPNQINREKLTGYYKITEPKTDLFRTTFAITSDNVEPNYTYIYNQFSKYLEEPYQDYLNHKMQYQILRKDQALWVYEHRNKNITKDKLIEYIISLRNILNEYPNFELWYYLQSDIKIYLDALLFEDWKMPNEPPIKDVLAKFLKVAQKGTYEYETAEKFYYMNTNENEYENSYEAKYEEWHDRTFDNDGIPIITQREMNIHANAVSEYKQKEFNKKVQSYKNLQLNDNGTLVKYINDYNKRKNNLEVVVFPHKNSADSRIEYGSSFPIQLAESEELFNELELFTYRKITDTYQNKYEHVNKIKMKAYHEYYEQVKQNILNSEYFANDMKKYLSNYNTRKNLYKQIVSDKMSNNDFNAWFDKLELYSYKIILIDLSRLKDNSGDINKIFAR